MEVEKIDQDKSTHGGARVGAGRPKGVPNKVSRQVKENIISVFEELGGREAMTEWAKRDERNMTEFYRMYTRMAPIEQKISGDAENPIQMAIGWMK
jgi:hypothetical protein